MFLTNTKGMMKNKNRAQGSIEFLIIFSVFLLFFVVFFSIIKLNLQKKNIEKASLTQRRKVAKKNNAIGSVPVPEAVAAQGLSFCLSLCGSASLRELSFELRHFDVGRLLR